MATATPLLAHQGGWDEILLIAGPIALIAGLLILAKRRLDAKAATGLDTEMPQEEPETAP